MPIGVVIINNHKFMIWNYFNEGHVEMQYDTFWNTVARHH